MASDPKHQKRQPQTDDILNEPLRDHVYDGIQEFDNRLPNWWLWTFYLAVIFTVLYWMSWYQSRVATPDDVRVDTAIAAIEAKRLASLGEISNETLWQMAANNNFAQAGKAVYDVHCATCHLSSLKGFDEGGLGESLIDQKWLYGNDALYVYGMVANGSPDKASGMVAWAPAIGPRAVTQVVAYVLSHHTPESLATSEVTRPGTL